MNFQYITCSAQEFNIICIKVLHKIGLFYTCPKLKEFVEDVSNYYQQFCHLDKCYVLERINTCRFLIKITHLHYEICSDEIKMLLIYFMLCDTNIPDFFDMLKKHHKNLGLKGSVVQNMNYLMKFKALNDINCYESLDKFLTEKKLNVTNKKIYSCIKLSIRFYAIKSFPLQSYYYLHKFQRKNIDIDSIYLYYFNIGDNLKTSILCHINQLKQLSKNTSNEPFNALIYLVKANVDIWNELIPN